MREIKFRAWDGKKFWQVSEIRLINQDPELIAQFGPTLEYVVSGVDSDGNRFEGSANDTPIVFYTGLKDKNGKEIYEGDIVKYYVSPSHSKQWQTQAVEYLNGAFSPLPGYTYSDDLSDFHNEGYEVIGNIYENPELLKQA